MFPMAPYSLFLNLRIINGAGQDPFKPSREISREN
jgi:hypothetical protein